MPVIKIELSLNQVRSLSMGDEIVITLSENSVNSAMSRCEQPVSTPTFFMFIKQRIEQLRQSGNKRTQETYQAAFNKFARFRNGIDLQLSALTPEVIDKYQCYLRANNLSMNTVSFYMRILRAIYNRAIDEGLITDCHPFRHAYTGQPKTLKRALSVETMHQICQLPLHDPQLAFARDMFLFSFYTRGMAFVDMAYLRRSDIHDSVLTYKRRKTGQLLTIKWERQMQNIADRYPNPSTGYLLPFITKENGKERNQYRRFQTHINKQLKVIAQQIGLSTNLTMYCARHTWATIARELEVPMGVISRAMGHENERTTEIYVRSIDINTVDKANARIISFIEA